MVAKFYDKFCDDQEGLQLLVVLATNAVEHLNKISAPGRFTDS